MLNDSYSAGEIVLFVLKGLMSGGTDTSTDICKLRAFPHPFMVKCGSGNEACARDPNSTMIKKTKTEPGACVSFTNLFKRVQLHVSVCQLYL